MVRPQCKHSVRAVVRKLIAPRFLCRGPICRAFSPRCANQLEHLESLLLSHLATTAHEHYARLGEPEHYAHAVASLHNALFSSWHRWRVHTSFTSENVKKISVREQTWHMPSPKAQLEDIMLYLLIWGRRRV